MNPFKSILIYLILFATTMFSSLTFATLSPNTAKKDLSEPSAMFRSPMGCMSCHQSQATQPNPIPKKNQKNPSR